ncbi:MAG: ribonuclease D [Gemmatimonadales bacterium]|nr:MAG: ribonuclease D [Gemmatimonadales bacterium]
MAYHPAATRRSSRARGGEVAQRQAQGPMDIRLIDRDDELQRMQDEVGSARRISLDCEAAGFHRYSDRLCLVQLTAGSTTYILDPFSVSPETVLRPLLEDPSREVVMHGADFDLRLLDRDLGIHISGLFDTQVAATLLGKSGIGLQSLLSTELGIDLPKKYQRADWALRPLPDPMLQYAAKDTIHLMDLADRLNEEAERAGRRGWVEEELRELEKIRFSEPEPADPAARMKASRDLSDREVHRLREALEWRDAIARERDRAPFRIANDSVLVEIARQSPQSMDELMDVRGLNGRLARESGGELLERLARVNALPDAEVQGLPRRDGNGRGRPPPEEEERFYRLKDVRNQTAERVGIDRGALISNSVLTELAAQVPRDMDELLRIPAVRRWQVEVMGSELLAALNGSS